MSISLAQRIPKIGSGWHYFLDLSWSAEMVSPVQGRRIRDAGAEILVLRGMKYMLVSGYSPRTIFMEVHPNFLKHFGSYEEEVKDVLIKSGYS